MAWEYTINIYHKKLIFANTQKKDYILILTEQIHQSNKVQQHSFFEASLFNKIPIKLIPPIIKTYSQNYHHINRYTAVSQYHRHINFTLLQNQNKDLFLIKNHILLFNKTAKIQYNIVKNRQISIELSI